MERMAGAWVSDRVKPTAGRRVGLACNRRGGLRLSAAVASGGCLVVFWIGKSRGAADPTGSGGTKRTAAPTRSEVLLEEIPDELKAPRPEPLR